MTPTSAVAVAPPGLREASVEIWDQGLVCAADWRDLRDGRAADPALAATDYRRYLAEDHHRLYGRPWSIGRSYFDFLRAQGLQPGHRVLDYGCGAGRIGIWLIGFLDPGRYVGVDHHWIALDAFARYEVPLHDLAARSPRLVLDGSLDVARLHERFDIVLDCYVSFHLGEGDRLKLYRGFAGALEPGGRIFLPHAPTLAPAQLAGLGLALAHEQRTPSPFLLGHHPKDHDHWHVIMRSRPD